MKSKIFFLCVFAMIVVSCGKNGNPQQFKGQYKSDTHGSVDDIMMYTNQGQVKDATTIQNFIQRRNQGNEFMFDNTSFPIDNSDWMMLSIARNKQVTISTNTSPESKKAEIIDWTSSQLIIAYIDSSHVLVPTQINRCQTLYSNIKKIIPEQKYAPLPPISGSSGTIDFRATFPIEITQGKLTLPITTFLVTSSDVYGSYCMLTVSNEWNTFNPDILNQLRPGDTIVYQTKRIQLLKQ